MRLLSCNVIGSGEELKNLHHVCRPSVDDDPQQLLLSDEEKVSETLLKGLLNYLCSEHFVHASVGIPCDADCSTEISRGRGGRDMLLGDIFHLYEGEGVDEICCWGTFFIYVKDIVRVLS